MGEKLDKPNLNKNSSDGKLKAFRFGMSQIQGWKKTMEVFNIKQIELDKKNHITIFGLFDGHSGKEISQYLSLNFAAELSKNINFINGDYKKALIETFQNIDMSLRTPEINNKLVLYSQQNKLLQRQNITDIYKEIDNNNVLNKNDIQDFNTFMDILDPNNLEGVLISDYVGSSGIIILVSEKITYVAKVGNSHCIATNKNFSLIKEKTIIEQNLFNKSEKNRIKIAKGIMYGKEREKNFDKEEYLYTRGFGDFQYKSSRIVNMDNQEIICKPDIFEIPNNDAKYLIICNSGLFESARILCNNIKNNKIIEKYIANFFKERLENKQKIISDAIGDFFNEIMPKRVDTNLSCIIIDYLGN